MSDLYLISGEEYLAAETLDRIRRDEQTDPLGETMFDATAEGAQILEALTTPSLLGGRRLVVLRGAHDLTKDQAQPLLDYLESPTSDACLVLIASGRTKLDAVVKKGGTVLSLDAPKGRRLIGWIRQRAKEHEVAIDDRGAWALVDSVGNELRDLDAALEQLATGLGSGARVGPAEVRRAFPRLADERIFAFTDAVGERRLPVAMTALRRLLEQGDEPLLLFGALSAHVRRLLRARRYADAGKRAVGEALGLPDWRAERMMNQARSYREDELVGAVEILAHTDVEMKGDFPSPQAALERAVVLIVGG